MEAIEALNPTAAPVESELLGGKWSLLYTGASAENAATRRAKEVRRAGCLNYNGNDNNIIALDRWAGVVISRAFFSFSPCNHIINIYKIFFFFRRSKRQCNFSLNFTREAFPHSPLVLSLRPPIRPFLTHHPPTHPFRTHPSTHGQKHIILLCYHNKINIIICLMD